METLKWKVTRHHGQNADVAPEWLPDHGYLP